MQGEEAFQESVRSIQLTRYITFAVTVIFISVMVR